jgi:RNA polymerase subunit RPABC4/transcription elongation factor Spt4
LKCPVCGTQLPQGAKVCPACHASISVSRRAEEKRDIFCKNCGAQVPPGETACPYCGFPLADEDVVLALARSSKERDEAPQAVSPESVIPDQPTDGYSAASRLEHMPHLRVAVVAAVAALVVVGGGFLLVTRPWDPNSRITHSMVDRDTSWAGFPGVVETLTGQDKSRQDADASASDSGDPYYDELKGFYESLGSLSQRLDSNESTLKDLVAGGDGSAEQGAADAQAISIELSNKISEFSGYDMSDSPYAEEYGTLSQLGSYLRNRADAIASAWGAVTAAQSPTDAAKEVEGYLGSNSSGSGSETWKSLFDEGYEAAKPEQQQ